ncbi:MAG: hypothetical protein COA79_04025 [Planctomycetota bacterium]|nr:MAG: hypothetical protein COA79_04025 [Planctomycetota bacterium]
MRFKNFITLLLILLLPFIWIGCGSSSSNEKATITFTIDDITATNQKKQQESGDNISEVKVLDLVGNEIGTLTHIELRTYNVELTKGISFIIQAIIKNGNNGEFKLETIIEKAKTEAVDVNQDSTEIASIIRERANERNQQIKDFIKEHEDETANIIADINNIETRKFINEALENIGNAESIEEVAKQLEIIIKELVRITNIIEEINNNIKQFNEGSGENFHHDDFNENDQSRLTTEELANQLGGAQDGETGEEKDFDIEINEDGSVVVRNGELHENIATNLETSSIVKGEITGISAEAIELGFRTDEGIKESRFVNTGSNSLIKEILNSLHIGEEISIKYEVDGNKKNIINIFGRGVTTGEVIEKGEAFILVKDKQGNQTKFTPQWISSANDISINDEPISNTENLEANEVNNNTTSSANDEHTNKKSKGQLDPDIIAIIEKITLGDNVAVIWEINERKRIIDIKWTDKLNIEGSENDNPNEPIQLNQIKKISGKISGKGDNFFTILHNTQDTTTEPESVKITINHDLAYHKEILASLLSNDEVSVKYIQKETLNLLDSIFGEGTFKGTLIQVAEKYIVIKDEDGHEIRFTPNWVKNLETLTVSENGGLDPEMLAVFKTLELESTISIKWILDERKRVVSIIKETVTKTEEEANQETIE